MGTHYVGAWFTAAGEVPQQLAAATENGLLTTVGKLLDPGRFVGKEISIWQIGAGDRVEIAVIEKE